MTTEGSERFRALSLLFDELVDLDPPAREEIIFDRCAGDPALEGEVRALLEAEDTGDPGGFFASVVGAEAAVLAGSSMQGTLLDTSYSLPSLGRLADAAEPGATTKPREPEGPRGSPTARGPAPQR